MACKVTVGVIGYRISTTLLKALLGVPQLYPNLGCDVRLKTLCGRNRREVEAYARGFGFAKTTSDWRELVEDPEISLLVNGGPNDLHEEPCVAALKNGKHVFCEKPLARSVAEASSMERAASGAGVVSMVGFNYRFIPAVQLARRLITEGVVGKLHHAHFQYVDDSYIDPNMSLTWRMDREHSGRGVLGDVGSHAIDLARFLLGEPEAVSGFTRIIVSERGKQKTSAPDAAFGMLHFPGGEIASLEASAFATGKKQALTFQIYGREGALAWNLERLNDLEVCLVKDKTAGISGFRTVYVNLSDHQDLLPWPPTAHPVGIEISYLLEFHHFASCIAKGGSIAPLGTDFGDGLAVEVICEGLERSSRMDGRRVPLDEVAKGS